jgi:hypothetical protein
VLLQYHEDSYFSFSCPFGWSVGLSLRDAIGTPEGLAICTDDGQGVMAGVKEVLPTAEHRECMLHLVMNFKKRYSGKIFDDHLWAAAYSWSPYFFEKHWKAMDEAKPVAMNYIKECHTRCWGPSTSEGPQKRDLTMFLEHNT